jgi:hypothetical protein
MTFSRFVSPAAALLLTLGLGACAENGTSCLDHAQPRRTVAADAGGQVKDRYLDDATQFLGAAYEFDCGEFTSTSRLRSTRDKATGAVVHQLMIKRHYETTGWHYYNAAAALEPEEPLKLTLVDRYVGKCSRVSWMGCQHAEEITLDLPQALVSSAAEQPRQIRVRGIDGNVFQLWLTPEQVREHLAAIAGTPR